MSYTDLRDFTPEFIADTSDGTRLELEKLGGGTVGEAYDGTWRYVVTFPAAYGRESRQERGQDLETPLPKTHEEAAEILCDFLDLDWEDFTPVTGRYVVLAHDGLGGDWSGPEGPTSRNTCQTLADTARLFRKWLVASGNYYMRAEGYGQPWADVVRRESWDGTSYGDVTGGDGVMRLTLGPRGGIVRENF